MKKRLLLRSLSSLISLSVVLSYGMCVFAGETDDLECIEDESEMFVVEDPVSVDVDYDDYELAEGFIEQKLSLGKPVCYNKFDYEANLSGYEIVVYNYLLPIMSEIANGERTSTVITIPEDVLSIDFSAEDLGLDDLSTATNQEITAAVKNHFPVDTTKLWLSFIETCPYEMYWYDKTKGCSTAYKLSRKGSSYIHLYNYKVTFCVSEEYQDGDDKTVNSVFGEAVNSAAANVRSIINEYAGLDDYHKLLAYNNKICLLTDYNYPAYENKDTPYGNPWQIIWVFDGDDSTKVVCEGYAKAFQYLCDNSAFRDDSLYVLSLYGSCNDGGHMWNLVHMDDGNNYLVDVTHSDPGGDGNYGMSNFMKGATSGSASSGYTVNNKLYKYNPALVDYYGEDTVSLASSDYKYVDPDGKHIVVLSSVCYGSAVLSKDSALEGEEINVTVTPKDGYEFDYITVNDMVIYENTFTMPSENAFVKVVCVKTRYRINVETDSNGGVSYPSRLQEGATATLNVVPRDGYVLDYIKVDGEIITGNTFTMPAHDVNVFVAFKKVTYSISVGVSGPGSIETSDYKANPGDVVTITSIPDEGYKLDSITVYDFNFNEISVTNNAFTMPESDVTVYATFVKADYTVTLSEVQNGTATLSASVAQMGDTVTVTVSSATGYELDSIKVNGTKISGKTFTMPASDTTVEVTFKKISYAITVAHTNGGAVGVSKTSANYGDTITVTTTPEEGYKLCAIKVNGETISGNTFSMPAGSVELSASFVKADYNITLSEVQNGTATLSALVANMGDTITVTVSPAIGYELDSIKVNGTKISGKSFTMTASDTTVEVAFKKVVYTISVAQGIGGTVGVSKTSANYGDTITVTATPGGGYKLSAIKVNGTTIPGNSFSMPADNVEVSATFVKADYNVTLSEVQNGTATLSALVANMGDTITVTVSPATGYELDSIKVNSTKISGNSFTMPAADTSVEVTFKKILYTISVVQSSGGTIGVSKTSANFGDVITVTVAPNEGYTLNTLKMNGTAISGKSFSMPAENVEVSASFVKAEYKVTLASVQNGTASLSASVANMGDAITVIVSPAIGYELDSIKVNGTKISGNSFTMPAADVTVEVAFKAITYTVTLTYDAELVAVEGIAATDSSRFGDKYEFKVTPVEGYEILSVKVNGAEISAVDCIYTVTQPDEDIEIVIELSEIYVPKSGWITEDGNKYYFEDDNPVKGWYRIAGSWYFFNADGVMQTGWLKAGSAWYYLDGSGVMVTGWLSSGGKWYYLKSSGVMATGWNKISGKWYYLESSGTMVSGWKQISGKWYYFESSGSMVTGWKQIGGKWYVFETSGAMKTGWYKEGNIWYYLKTDGSMATGWLETGGKWYYFYSSGAMASNTMIDGYKLGNDGAWIK